MAKIENWCLVHMNDNNGYDAPETRKLYFGGNVFGHPFFEDGHRVITSHIVSFSNGKFYTFSGTEYELGKVDEGYEKEYPNAYERVLKSLE